MQVCEIAPLLLIMRWAAVMKRILLISECNLWNKCHMVACCIAYFGLCKMNEIYGIARCAKKAVSGLI